jgi:hypothetical protein
MNPEIEINSLAINKLKNKSDGFVKYDIDVALDEVENNENGIKLKYKIVLLSNPTNTKISVEEIASVSGNETKVSKYLAPDQKNIPSVVNVVYQEIFPHFYVISKSMQIPCPSYRLSQISTTQQPETKEENVKQEIVPPATSSVDAETTTERPDLPSESSPEVIQEANVNSI